MACEGVAPHLSLWGWCSHLALFVLSLALLTQALSSPWGNVELMLTVSTAGDPCHSLVQIWGLKGDYYKADLCTFACMQLLIEKLATA